ncbi:RICIN domain-containing protein [Streptomyces sp. NBC_01390]|uniref:RICIN domain-containing protein n=1 Tax=Streptomyces sp. NBC_01390 TaxID=2903850 RepID=UPI0032569B14
MHPDTPTARPPVESKLTDINSRPTALESKSTHHWPQNSPTKPAPGAAYKLTYVPTGKVLDVNGFSATVGLQLQQWTSTGGTNQQWYLQPNSEGYFTIVSHDSGLVADDNGWDTSEAAKVVQYTAGGGANQQWQLIPA